MNKNNKIIGSVVIVAIFCVFTIVGIINSNKDENYEDIFVESKPVTIESSNISNANSNNSSSNNKSIKVEIKGEVQKPGVYNMNSSNRLEDLIQKAGGFTANADKERVPSLARKVKDEECIIIPNKSTPETMLLSANSGTNSDNGVININTADKDGLQKIPGVGPVTAQKILDYREKHGDFGSVEDMNNIDGIGDKTLDKMRDSITVN